jgi:sporulation protein YlmC with PRC-barrel domain
LISQAELIALRAPAKDDGYYLVPAPPPVGELAEATLAEAAALLRLKVPELNRILVVGQPLPLSRVATAEDAAGIGEGLRRCGIETVTVAHTELHLEVGAKKIRALEVSHDAITAIPTTGSEKVTVPWDDVTLVVAGRLISNRQETEERKRRGRKQTVASRQLSADESVLDLYPKSDDGSWRINSNNFDFSCLGSAKSMTTFANFAALISLLRERATNAQVDDSYNQARPALAIVWPLEEQTRKGEWRRSGAGKLNVATVTTSDNEAQFTRYSRLRHCLRLRELLNSK